MYVARTQQPVKRREQGSRLQKWSYSPVVVNRADYIPSIDQQFHKSVNQKWKIVLARLRAFDVFAQRVTQQWPLRIVDRVRWKEVKKYSNDLNTNKEMFGKKKTSDSAGEWTKTGSFLHKPSRGWLHSDNSLQEGGVCYAVKVS